MSLDTKIQWCDSTVNPTMGCEGCELWTSKVKKCYAGMLHVRFGGITKGYSPTFEELTYWRGRMTTAARWPDLCGKERPQKRWLDGLPRLIFVSDMSDSLSGVVPFDFLEKEVVRNATSQLGQRHRWLWLTKRPDRMARFSEWLFKRGIVWPENLWAGTSITTQGTTNRIKHLLRVGNDLTLRFLSIEPQYEPLDLTRWLTDLDWIIHGGESGHDSTPFHIEWALDLIEQCKAHHIPYFLKQLGTTVIRNGSRLRFNDYHAGDWTEWPDRLRVRQIPIKATISSANRPERNGKPKSKAELSAIAKKAWATRRENEKKRKRSDAALKAWQTRRSRQPEQ